MRAWLLRRLMPRQHRVATIIFIESTTIDATGRITIDGHGTALVRPGEYLLTPIGGNR